MTIRISVTHHDAESEKTLAAEVFNVSPGGDVSDFPLRADHIEPGGTAVVHLHAGNVLVVRELGPLRV